jgi:antitoxin (DNA-binding transcriptional repressor) of toxin-antitoxin stability system
VPRSAEDPLGHSSTLISGRRPSALDQLVPIESAAGTRELGFAAGRVTIADDFDAPLPDDVLDSFDATSA